MYHTLTTKNVQHHTLKHAAMTIEITDKSKRFLKYILLIKFRIKNIALNKNKFHS